MRRGKSYKVNKDGSVSTIYFKKEKGKPTETTEVKFGWQVDMTKNMCKQCGLVQPNKRRKTCAECKSKKLITLKKIYKYVDKLQKKSAKDKVYYEPIRLRYPSEQKEGPVGDMLRKTIFISFIILSAILIIGLLFWGF